MTRSSEELRAGALHVAYEVSMLHVATAKAASAIIDESPAPTPAPTAMTTSPTFIVSVTLADTDDEFMRNALVEVALFHARNLSEFLFPRPNAAKPDDLLATDYLPEWAADPAKIEVAGEPLDVLRKRVDKHLSHLTFERVSNPDPGWAIALVRDLLAQFENFYHQLHGERRDWFGPGLAHFFS